MEAVYWYEKRISNDDLQEVKRFLESFVRKRSDALEKMWREFREWNIKTRRIDFAQAIAIGLTSGYSAALKKVLQGICKDVTCLFRWNEIPGNDDGKLIEFLQQKYGIDWVKTAQIDKIGMTIRVFTGKNSLSLRLNDEKTKVNLKIDGGGEDEFVVDPENGILNVCDMTKISLLRIILIKSNGGEEILKAELIADYPGLKCYIMPMEVIEQKEISYRIGEIFVGIESINKKGDIVHPRGGSEIIKKIKEYKKDIKVYAVGESYKVQDFTEEDIDYTKLSLFPYENIDYLLTDHGVHERKEVFLFSWDKIPGSDNGMLIEFIGQNFGIDWVKTAKIEKNDDGMTIRVSTEKNSLSLRLNDEKTKINLIIDDGRTDKFIVKMEKGELNIYKGDKWEIKADLRNDLDCCIQYWRRIIEGR